MEARHGLPRGAVRAARHERAWSSVVAAARCCCLQPLAMPRHRRLVGILASSEVVLCCRDEGLLDQRERRRSRRQQAALISLHTAACEHSENRQQPRHQTCGFVGLVDQDRSPSASPRHKGRHGGLGAACCRHQTYSSRVAICKEGRMVLMASAGSQCDCPRATAYDT